ncbi:MAG TPA: aromatic ring-hydroxylating dioxygenase subunit alpha [Alphaproteobacteria bacterium]|nr:aromatic ring-hydroxylating dioxygenase subunit alpha [Alphaproteobacteria bacterium]
MPDDAGRRAQRCPGPSTADIVAADAQPAPAFLGESNAEVPGPVDLGVEAYTSPDFHRREIKKIWRRCWQIACREDQLAKPGDFLVYDIADDSAIVLRDRGGELRAFINSCPHRGTRICDGQGHQTRLRCPFHALTWSLEGTVKEHPGSWDFPDLEAGEFDLDEIGIGTWGGFVFVNFDRAAPPLEDYLEDLPAHFASWPLDRRFTAAHVVKRLACNWKVTIEAFIETFHVIGIHPEAMPFFGDANSQYDLWPGRRHVSRMINPSGVGSPHLADRLTPERIVEAAAKFGLCEGGPLAPGETPRGRVVAHLRRFYETTFGIDLSTISDSEVADVIEYSLFPNAVLFGGYGSPLAYRSRPDGDDPNRSIFEVWLLLPYAGDASRPSAPTRVLGDSENFADVPELSYYGPVIDQDALMMPRVQRGLRSSWKGRVTLSRYQESRIRHMRRTLAEYLARE